MKRFFIFILLSILFGILSAQEDEWLIDTTWIEQEDFEQFKQQSETKFDSFRDSINIRFAKALAGEWTMFKVDKPRQLPQKPKPKTPPINKGENLNPQQLPKGEVVPLPNKVKKEPQKLPPPSIQNNMTKTKIMFYNADILVDIPQKDMVKSCVLASTKEKDVSLFWQQMTKTNVQACINKLLLQQEKLQLNDWAMYEMALKLSKQLFSDANRQVATTVFLMNQMEYDVRIARTEKGLACLLAMDCKVYSIPYVTIGGKQYYIFLPNSEQRNLSGNIYSYTCTMDNAILPLNMVVNKTPLLPLQNRSMHKYSRSVDKYSVEVEVNESIIKFYKDYPQVDMHIYANAMITEELKNSIDTYFRPIIEGKNVYQAVSTLLHYMQYGFDYATDDEQFGYEKPFFPEENFYYPQNDCEDRGILFSYLVRYLLQLDVVLIDYPNHIATAVCFPSDSNVTGDYYEYDNKKYIVCDPTYIGASIGMSQPECRNEKVKIITLQPIDR